MSKTKLCTQYEAACITGLSPELLIWLTSYAAKTGISRKLKIVKNDNDAYFFEEKELLEFNEWLKAPWPHKDGKRPSIPISIRREIKNEANGECAICHGHKDTCEAAHIDPVHKSHNNHPENLLWLCSNHHTAYDGGLFFGPNGEDKEFVIDFKRVLHRYKLLLWRTQHEVSQKLLTVLQDCDGLARQLKKAKTEDQVKAVEKIATATLESLPALAPVSRSDPKYQSYKSIAKSIQSLSEDSHDATALRLEKAHEIRVEYTSAYGFVKCPLCRGGGLHDGVDCPVCQGDREIEEGIVDQIDLSMFDKVDCPVCEGCGKFEGNDDCPVCGGNAQMDRRYAEWVDVTDYQKVSCPLCNGSTRHRGEECPHCHGEGEFERRYINNFDINDYSEVKCPLCAGEGHYENHDCPECHGDKMIERRFAALIDLDRYSKVDCPVCDGKGSRNGNDCPVCDGNAQIDRHYLDRIDVRGYDLVKCPACKGKGHAHGEDCRTCGGDRKIERRFADRV